MKVLYTLGVLLFVSQHIQSAPLNDSETVGDYTRAAAPTSATDSFFTVYLDVNSNCKGVYNRLIDQLQRCRDGIDHGDAALSAGCFLDFNLNEGDCSKSGGDEDVGQIANSAIYFPSVTETPWHPTPPCNGEYCTERGPTWPAGSSVHFEDGSYGSEPTTKRPTTVTPTIEQEEVVIIKSDSTTQTPISRTVRPPRRNIINNLLQLIQQKNQN